jgi:hypothetical protein
LGSTCNEEFYCRRMKNFWNSNFVNQGGCLFQKLKMACPRDLKAIIVFSQPVPLRVERARSTDVFVHIFDSINAMSLKIPPIDSA